MSRWQFKPGETVRYTSVNALGRGASRRGELAVVLAVKGDELRLRFLSDGRVLVRVGLTEVAHEPAQK